MADVLHRMKDGLLCYYCPGCEHLHAVWLTGNPNPQTGAEWSWNGDMVKPTFSPSLHILASPGIKRCHSHVINGTIQYLTDCEHRLAGVTVPMSPDPLEQV